MFRKIFLGILNFLFCHVMYRVKYINKENLDNTGKCIICPNHSNTLEPFWIYLKEKLNTVWIMAKAEMFENKLIGKIFLSFNVFPIKRGQKDARSLLHAINIVKEKEGARLLIFPEGTRIPKTKERGRAKVGPVYIAAKAGVPIVPVYITKNARLFSSPKVIYGEAIQVPKELLEDKKQLQEFTNKLLDTIYNLKEVGEKKK